MTHSAIAFYAIDNVSDMDIIYFVSGNLNEIILCRIYIPYPKTDVTLACPPPFKVNARPPLVQTMDDSESVCKMSYSFYTMFTNVFFVGEKPIVFEGQYDAC